MADLIAAISRFGAEAKAKLANPGAAGEPEDQLRAPLEGQFADLAELCGFKREWLAAIGESALSALQTRPDYAVTLRKLLVGYVKVRAPGRLKEMYPAGQCMGRAPPLLSVAKRRQELPLPLAGMEP